MPFNQNPYMMYGGYQQGYYPIAQQPVFQPNAQMQPQMQPQQQQQRPSVFSQPSNFYENVNSFDEVKAYHMPPNSQMLFVDANKPYLYNKATDMSGRAEIHAFELKEIPIEEIGNPKIDLSGYVTKEEFQSSQEKVIQSISDMESRITEHIRVLSEKSQEKHGDGQAYQSHTSNLSNTEQTTEKQAEIKRETPVKRTSKAQEVKDESVNESNG